MKRCLLIIAISLSFFSIAVADSHSDSWHDSGIAMYFHLDEIPVGETNPDEQFTKELVFSGKTDPAPGIPRFFYDGYINGLTGKGEIRISRGHGWGNNYLRMIWDLDFKSPKLVLETKKEHISYPITPVVVAASITEQQFGSTSLSTLFPEHSKSLEAVLGMPEVSDLLPNPLVRELGLSPSSNAQSSDLSMMTDDAFQWACGITCGGVIGSGIFTIVSGGALSPSLVVGASACGSCMGYTWGDHVTRQPPVDVPGGSSVPIGQFLPPLPPGWVWECVANNSGGYTCTPTELGVSYDPY